MSEIERRLGPRVQGRRLAVGFPPPYRSSFAGVRVDELMGVSDRSRGAPAVEERPGRYVGCFENKFGELLVFVHDAGERDAAVFLGDVDWERRRVRDAGGRPDVGDLILNDEERAFVDACWIATAWRRDGARAGRPVA
ncbi:MAG: hypothetical protein ACLP22_17490 [Solirubrobacteraceae bacterium]